MASTDIKMAELADLSASTAKASFSITYIQRTKRWKIAFYNAKVEFESDEIYDVLVNAVDWLHAVRKENKTYTI